MHASSVSPFRPSRCFPLSRAVALALLLLSTAPSFAAKSTAAPKPRPSIFEDVHFRDDASAALDSLYDFDFPTAEARFRAIEARYPGHPVGPMLRALVPWWRLLIDPEDTSLDREVLSAMDEALVRARRRLNMNPDDRDGLFFEAGALAFRARVATLRKGWVSAGNDGRKALKNLRRLQKIEPDNVELYFGIGLFDYLADEIPSRYKFLKPVALLFPRGDKKRGLAELDRAAWKGRFVAAETHFALAQILDQFERDYARAAVSLEWLRDRYPNNAIFHVAQGRLYAKWGRLAEAGVILQEVAERQVDGKVGYTGAVAQESLYWLARIEMAQGRHEQALQVLDRLEFLASERTYDAYYQAVGRLRRGMALDALGRRDEAVRCYREVLEMAGAGDARDRAREFLDKAYRAG